ncbi:MAG: S-layer homology domain-containing protein [Oscillospiraceae bacterium]|nr:S-layer homology domain-containing protein [Oscillospiraceae bacterium]
MVVKTTGDNLYVEFQVEHFSTFELMTDGVYTIIFNANGGEGGSIAYVPEGGTVTAPTPTRSGYTFNGWSPAFSAMADADVTYTAQWTRNSSGGTYYGGSDSSSSSSDGSSSGSSTPANGNNIVEIGEDEVPLTNLPLNFVDVAANDWFRDGVAYVFNHGLMNGTDVTTFSPYLDSTRGMVAAILYRLTGSPDVEAAFSFVDMSGDDYFTEAASWADANGVFIGFTDGTFRGDVAITREQLALVLYRYSKLMGYEVSGDDALAWAVEAGLLQGDETGLNPEGLCNRAMLATVLMRFCETVAK